MSLLRCTIITLLMVNSSSVCFSAETESANNADPSVFSLATLSDSYEIEDDALKISVNLDSSNLFIAGADDGFSLDGLRPQTNRITTSLGVPGYKLNEVMESYEILKHKPGWIIGFELTTQFDPHLIKEFVEREALYLVDKGVEDEIARRQAEAINLGETAALEELEKVRVARAGQIQEQIASSPKFNNEVDRQRSLFAKKIPGQVDKAIAADPNLSALMGGDLQKALENAPTPAVKEQIQDQIDLRDEQLAAIREELIAQALSDLDSRVQELSENLKKDLEAAANAQLDAEIEKAKEGALAEGRAEALKELRRRTQKAADQIRASVQKYSSRITEEKKFHQVAIGLGRVLKNQQGLVYIRFGKIQVESGPSRDSQGRSFSEALSGINSFAERGSGVDNTVGFNAGAVIPVGKSQYINMDFYVFHNRMASTDERSSLVNQLALIPGNEEELNQQTRFTHIDSALARVAYHVKPNSKYVRSAEVYATLGQYNDAAGVSAGGQIQFNGCLSISASFYLNENSPVRSSKGAAIQIGCKIDRVTGFLRYEVANDIIHNGDKLDQLKRIIVGAQFELYKKCIRSGSSNFCGTSYATLAAIRDQETREFNGGKRRDTKWSGAAGLKLAVTWQ